MARLAKACISVLKRKADGYSLNMALLGLCESIVLTEGGRLERKHGGHGQG